MKRILLFCTSLCLMSALSAQVNQHPFAIQLKNGVFTPGKNLLKKRLNSQTISKLSFREKKFVLLQFSAVPTEQEKQDLKASGIKLFDYLPGNGYLAEASKMTDLSQITSPRLAGIYAMPAASKIASDVRSAGDAFNQNTEKLISVSFFGSVTKAEVAEELRKSGATIIETKIQPSHAIFINANAETITKIAALPFVSYVGVQEDKPRALNYNNRGAHAIDALSALPGRNLKGKGITVGIGDDADPSSHIDFTGRLILRNPQPFNYHGTHTTGSVAGGGILDPMYQGMAPKATIVSQSFYDILINAPTYVNDYNMVLTNNSYTVYNGGCPDGAYDVYSSYADDQMNVYDSLLHVFASGNDGQSTCSPYPFSFGTIKSGFQSAKNVLTVGASDNYDYTIGYFSSRGPVNDGRIKPEIVAGGVAVTSTFPDNTYGSDDGTSMAAPTATGALALVYERYRQLHAGKNPSAALVKAAACNGAEDLGSPGPDYTFGFGLLNARAAVETIENNHYFNGVISNGTNTSFTIPSIPAGTGEVKIMLYWSDPAASSNAGSELVNDLDLTVLGTDNVLHHPLVLNSNPGNVNDAAQEGIDNLNNIEQVVIQHPAAGDLTITVSGSNVPMGPQAFVVVYEIVNPSVTVEYPFGTETLVPGQTENLRWNYFGGTGNSFTVEYSLNHGSTWNTISSTVPDGSNTWPWTVPDTATNTALIRVTRNGAGYTNTSTLDFCILGQPVITVTNPCQGYAKLLWRTIPSATSYEIMQLKADSMQAINSTTDTTFTISGLNKDSVYWFTVRALNQTVAGRRAIAASIQPSGGSCSLQSKDFSIDSLILPTTGRIFTSTQLTSNTTIKVELKNLAGIASSGSYNISYQVNNGAIVTETSAISIASNTASAYTFVNPFDFSGTGVYQIKTWVDYPGDTLHLNDTLTSIIKQLANAPVSLAPSYTEGFETAADTTYVNSFTGLAGVDRADFRLNSINGRARTFVNTGFPRTGNRAVTLDQSHSSGTAGADSLLTTFNLSAYAPTEQVWLDFYYLNHGTDFSLPGNAVWIRGNDQAPWLPALTLNINPLTIGTYLASGSIDVTGILANAAPPQTLSSSFQVKFGQEGYTSANSVIPDANIDDGYSFDDITLTRAMNDAALVALISPTNICELSNAEVIKVKVKNYTSSALTNINVSYSINGSTVTEVIASLAAKDSVIYSFAQTADLSAFQHYTINTWVSCAGDTYHSNDSLLNINFQTAPLINSFPYLQGFETDNGSWYTDGINDSWAWGTPAKSTINKAANGTKAWVTNLTGNYNNNELSYLYSPCFDLSTLTHPVFSFSHIFQTEDDCDCDYHWVEYSTDDINWVKLGAVGGGTNWYDNSARQAWQVSDGKWHVSSYDVPLNPSKLRFRIVMNSDPGVTYEGVGIDDIHVFEKSSIYSGANIDAGLTQNVSGSSWINFTSSGKIVAAINPNGQNLGNTSVYEYKNTLPIRHTTSQYYLDRNIVIKPTNAPTDSVSVRFYFLNTEVNKLINATGCPACSTISDAYQSGVTQYSGLPAQEDSTLNNNISGTYRYILPHTGVTIVPNDNGYYAEYKVVSFSEFWINNGGPSQNQPLPLILESFTASKIDNSTGLLKWSVTQVVNLSSFVIEKSADGTNFSDIGTVTGKGDTAASYEFTDLSLFHGVNYYRLRIIDRDGHIQYSPVKTITVDGGGFDISVFPNPISKGNLHVITSANCTMLKLTDMSGRLIRKLQTEGLQHILSINNISKGIYMLEATTASGTRTEKIVVE